MENKINYQITTGTVEDINAIAQFQVDMAAESEGTILDIARVTPGVAAVMDDPYKGNVQGSALRLCCHIYLELRNCVDVFYGSSGNLIVDFVFHIV